MIGVLLVHQTRKDTTAVVSSADHPPARLMLWALTRTAAIVLPPNSSRVVLVLLGSVGGC